MNDFTEDELNIILSALSMLIGRTAVFDQPIEDLLDLFDKVECMVKKMVECKHE